MYTKTLLTLAALWLGQAADLGTNDLYPPERQERVLRFFSLKGELDRGRMHVAIKEIEVEIVQGPVGDTSKPSITFVAVHAPWDMKVRTVSRALGKGGVKVEELECITFEGRAGDEELPQLGLGLTTRQYILGMSGDIRWFDSNAGRTQFYGPVGKLESEDIEKRYRRLYEPFGGGTIGDVVREQFTWPLPKELDVRAAKKLRKKVAKLDGVAEATVVGARLEVTVELDGLSVSGPSRPFPLPEQASEAEAQAAARLPRATFCTNELMALLESEQLAPGTRTDD